MSTYTLLLRSANFAWTAASQVTIERYDTHAWQEFCLGRWRSPTSEERLRDKGYGPVTARLLQYDGLGISKDGIRFWACQQSPTVDRRVGKNLRRASSEGFSRTFIAASKNSFPTLCALTAGACTLRLDASIEGSTCVAPNAGVHSALQMQWGLPLVVPQTAPNGDEPSALGHPWALGGTLHVRMRPINRTLARRSFHALFAKVARGVGAEDSGTCRLSQLAQYPGEAAAWDLLYNELLLDWSHGTGPKAWILPEIVSYDDETATAIYRFSCFTTFRQALLGLVGPMLQSLWNWLGADASPVLKLASLQRGYPDADEGQLETLGQNLFPHVLSHQDQIEALDN